METEYGDHWNIRDLLGDLMGASAKTQPQPRAEVWASDLGKPYVDRWLEMKGVPYSNPATGKDLMRFFLGKQIEIGIEGMLTRCGLPFRSQEKLRVEQEHCLPVVGRADLILEIADWRDLFKAVDERLSQCRERPGECDRWQALQGLLELWNQRSPQGLLPTVFEIKSLNSAAFRYHRGSDGLSHAYPHHRLQLYTYMHGLGLQEGHLVYVARDTGWMEEVVVRPSEELQAAWQQDVETMTHYYESDQRPPLEPLVVNGKDNWRVSYSRYKDHLYKEGTNGSFSF